MPELNFHVESVQAVPYAASPQLAFTLHITQSPHIPQKFIPVHSVMLQCQIRLEPARRKYQPAEQERLFELFGEPQRWGQTVRSLLWTHATLIVPPFEKDTRIDLPVACSYDFNLATAKYFNALDDGRVPITFLFSGSIFYAGADGALQVRQISWEKEADFQLPVAAWKQMMEIYYPNSAWLCLRRDAFERLSQFKRRRGLALWDQAIDALLDAAQDTGSAMSQTLVDRIAQAVMYEGYVLYPYRPSVKTRHRWTFGGIIPQSYNDSDAQTGDASVMQAQCLITAPETARLRLKLRFLHLIDRAVEKAPAFERVESIRAGDHEFQSWQEAAEREIQLENLPLHVLAAAPQIHPFAFPESSTTENLLDGGQIVGRFKRMQQAIDGTVELRAVPLAPAVTQLSIRIANLTPLQQPIDRDTALLGSFASTHVILHTDAGEFLSLTDPPDHARDSAAQCRNLGCWPVLVGPDHQTDTLLISPIILPDYPQIAAESPGDLFDGTEIDEILSLRILTLTDEEKRHAAATDDRVRRLLHATESLARGELMNLHGAMRHAGPDPLQKQTSGIPESRFLPGDRVRLHPRKRADIFDIALAGKSATIASVETDLENRTHLAVTIDDDPGNDLGLTGQPGHRFFFDPEEIELLARRQP